MPCLQLFHHCWQCSNTSRSSVTQVLDQWYLMCTGLGYSRLTELACPLAMDPANHWASRLPVVNCQHSCKGLRPGGGQCNWVVFGSALQSEQFDKASRRIPKKELANLSSLGIGHIRDETNYARAIYLNSSFPHLINLTYRVVHIPAQLTTLHVLRTVLRAWDPLKLAEPYVILRPTNYRKLHGELEFINTQGLHAPIEKKHCQQLQRLL